MTSGPNWGSRTPPITISWPAGAISSMRKPSTRDALIAGKAIMALIAAVASAGEPMLTLTPPASLLCRMSGETTLITTGALSCSKAALTSAAPLTLTDFGTVRPYAFSSCLPACSSSAARPCRRASAIRPRASIRDPEGPSPGRDHGRSTRKRRAIGGGPLLEICSSWRPWRYGGST